MEQLADYIGFLISFLAVLYLFFYNRFEKRNVFEDQAEYEQAESQVPAPSPYKNFLRVIENTTEDETLPLTRKRNRQTQKKTVKPKPALEIQQNLHQEPAIGHKYPTRASQLLRQLPQKKAMVIYYEVLHKPKGLDY